MSLRGITLQMASTGLRTKGWQFFHKICSPPNVLKQTISWINHFFVVMNRYVYVMDLLDHKVHVLEMKEDHALDFVKVNHFKIEKKKTSHL